MTAIDFYTLAENSRTLRMKAACQLVEQSFLAGERVLVWLQDPSALTAFDDLLWTFADRAFVPHEPLAGDPAASEAPVQLFAGSAIPPAALQGGFHTLVALRDEASSDALSFGRVIEVLDAEPACRTAGRARFRFYRERGATPNHHQIEDQ
jgi:DNA polymerase-3 subunit chi